MPPSGKTIVTSQPFVASAAAISEPMKPPPMTATRTPSASQVAQAPVVVERPEVDDVGASTGKAAAACRPVATSTFSYV